MIGVELPPEGTGSLEAIARGSAIMTLAYKGEYLDIYRGKPPSRRVSTDSLHLHLIIGLKGALPQKSLFSEIVFKKKS